MFSPALCSRSSDIFRRSPGRARARVSTDAGVLSARRAKQRIALLSIEFRQFAGPGIKGGEVAAHCLEFALETRYTSEICCDRRQMCIIEIFGEPGFERSVSAPLCLEEREV